MYPYILSLHSIIRWLVLISLVYAIFRAFKGWRSKQEFTKADDKIRHITATISHIQFTLGLILYFISPLVKYFLENFKTAVHQREIRFFGMEHSLMMFIAVVFISIGSSVAKRKTNSYDKFRIMAIWFSLALLIILSSVPWPFSPLTARPFLRGV